MAKSVKTSYCKHALLLSVLIGGAALTNCKSVNTSENRATSKPINIPNAASAPHLNISAQGTVDTFGSQQDLQDAKGVVKPSPPQIIKRAELALIVNSLDNSIRVASDIVKQQQGDLLGLQDQKLPDDIRHTVSMQIRVPQDRLDSSLEKLAQMGTIQSRSLTAEDVTNQLVDYQAQLRNLQKTESTLLKIMERSGSVGDVLKVAQELSNVRQSIEQIGAQLKNLQNQVAYSTITLKLEEAISIRTSERTLESRVQETWNTSTHSVSEFSISLLSLSLWLIVYSPYLLLLTAAIYGYNRLRRRQSQRIDQLARLPNRD